MGFLEGCRSEAEAEVEVGANLRAALETGITLTHTQANTSEPKFISEDVRVP